MSRRLELFEMGWNDVIGNMRLLTDTLQKSHLAIQLSAGLTKLSNRTKSYKEGTIAAANAFMRGERLVFKGPVGVIAELEARIAIHSKL